MKEKTDRNQRLYQFHLQHPNVSYVSLGKIFQRRPNGESKPLSPSAICRILNREKRRLEINPSAYGEVTK